MASSGRRLHQPGTFPRAALMLAILGAMAAGVAASWPRPSVRHPIEAYLRLGPSNGAHALRRDLLALSPAGSDAGPAVQRLVSTGFTCDAPDGRTGSWSCLFRRPNAERRLVSVEAQLSVTDGVVAAIATRISEPAR